MEPDAKYTLVGAVALALVAAIAVALIWLAGTRGNVDLRHYKIFFAHQSLEGLEARSDVKMKGIRVGAVTGFSFSTVRPGTVEVEIGVDPKAPVRASTRAVVDRNLITGLATIRLQNLDESSPALTDTATDGHEPVIAEGESQLQQFSETANQLAARADETMRKVDELLSPRNQAALTATLENLSRTSADAARLMSRADSTLASLGQAATAIGSTTGRLGDDAHRLVNRFDVLGVEGGESLREVTGSLQQLRAEVSRVADQTEATLDGANLEVATTARSLRSAADSVDATARRFDDPRAIVFGPGKGALGPGEGR